jgi:preprotein translocase subunit SecY
VTELPRTIFAAFELAQRGVFSDGLLIGSAGFSAVLVGFATFVEKARRREPVEFVTRENVRGSSYLSFKLNGAGIIPALIASWLLVVPVLFATVMRERDPLWWDAFARAIGRDQPLHMLGYAVAIFFFVYLYNAFLLDPSDAAAKLKRYGGRIAQVEPGEATAEHIDRVLSRITMIGALYFVVICLIPELLIYRAGLPFYLGGTSLLILVGTVLDIEKQARRYALEEVGG